MRQIMDVSRRTLVKSAFALGASVTIVGTVGPRSALANGDSSGADGAIVDVQYGFLVDMTRCVGCELCVDVCREHNQLSDDTPDRRRVSSYLDKHDQPTYVSTSCMHCGEPSCLRVCPAGAISKGDAGIVSVDQERCIGCKYCFQACPYEVPRYNSVAMDKCDCCLGAGVPAGETPHCVRACKFDALRYGPLDELMAQANDAAVPIAQANDPSCLLLGTRG